MIKYFALVVTAMLTRLHGAPIDFSIDKALPAGNIRDLLFVSRIIVPYGPDIYSDNEPQSSSERPFRGYGYGMPAAEEVAYDPIEKFMYVGSEIGYIQLVDFSSPREPQLTNFALDVTTLGTINDVAVCPLQGWMFVAIKEAGIVVMFSTTRRDNPADPQLLATIDVGNFPSQLLPNTNCTILAVSNENNDDLTHGTVTIIRDLPQAIEQGGKASLTYIPMDAAGGAWDDSYTLRKGLHMPMTRNALEYWDLHSSIAAETDYTEVRDKYRSSIFIEGESLSWAGPDESELLVNLQVNNGVLRIDVAQNKALALAGYGLKDHSVVPVDLNRGDKTCNLRTYPNLFSMRNPDGVTTLRYDGKVYLLTANEGDHKEYGDWEDAMSANEVFPEPSVGLPNMKISMKVYDPSHPLGGNIAPFHGNCVGDECVGGSRISIGSTSIDYELDPANPTFHRMVMIGGRGWTIYELPENPDSLLKLVFDSGDDLERLSCEHFPWAYNSGTDEELAPANNMPNNTLWRQAVMANDEDLMETLLAANDPEQDGCANQGDGTPGACPMSAKVDSQSEKGGPQTENVVIGVACGRLFAIVATEKESLAVLYDITNIASPDVIKIFHLSPASQHKSPGLAYNDGTIGEIDPESIIFLSNEESPTDKAAIIFAGAFSGSISFWEFECGIENSVGESSVMSSSNSFSVTGGLVTTAVFILMHSFLVV